MIDYLTKVRPWGIYIAYCYWSPRKGTRARAEFGNECTNIVFYCLVGQGERDHLLRRWPGFDPSIIREFLSSVWGVRKDPVTMIE